MNRFDNVSILVDEIIGNLTEKYGADWIDIAVRQVLAVSKTSDKFPTDQNMGKFIEEHDLQFLHVLHRQEVAAVLYDFVQLVGVVPGYSKGEALLKYYLYYMYASKEPMKVLLADAEFKDKWPDAERDIINILRDRGYSAANVLLDAACYVASKYVNKEYGGQKVMSRMFRWFKLSMNNDDLTTLRKSYGMPNHFTCWAMRDVMTSTLYSYMSETTINSTPLPVLLLYYVFAEEHSMYTISMGMPAVKMVKEISSSGKLGITTDNPDAVVCGFLSRKIAEKEPLPTGTPDSDIVQGLEKLLSDTTGNTEAIAIELTTLRDEIREKELVEHYTVEDLLRAYVYYRGIEQKTKKYFDKADYVQEVIKKRRELLPDAIKDISDVAALLISFSTIVDAGNVEDDRFKLIGIEEYLTDHDREVFGTGYYDLKEVLNKCKQNMAYINEVYSVQANFEEDALFQLVRYTMVVEVYKKSGCVPFLSVVPDRKEALKVIKNLVDTRGKRLAKGMSEVGVLLDYVVEGNTTEVPEETPILFVNFNNYDDSYFKGSAKVLKQATMIINSYDYTKAGIDTPISRLRDPDKLKCYCYCKVMEGRHNAGI